jgi:ornithine cyclodeaminase/alanine dehydrogenase-like protein (mu-crystallin family)
MPRYVARLPARPIESFRVFGHNPENREAFAKEATKLIGLPVEPVGNAREAVAGMDIVLTQTASLQYRSDG